MSDYITRQAQRVVDRIAANAIAAATTAFGKPLSIQVQQGIESAIADLLPGLEAEQRQEEADWQAEQEARQAERDARISQKYSGSTGFSFDPNAYLGASAGGTSSDD